VRIGNADPARGTEEAGSAAHRLARIADSIRENGAATETARFSIAESRILKKVEQRGDLG